MGLFSEIPAHNQFDVLKKLDFKDFVKFKQCSKETVELGSKFMHRLPMDVSSFLFLKDTCKLCKNSISRKISLKSISEEPVRFKMGKCVVDALCCQEIDVEDFCRKMKLRAKMLTLNHENFVIDSPTIDRFLKMLRSTVLFSVNVPSYFITNLEEINRLTAIIFYGNIDESDFLQMKRPILWFSEAIISLLAINKFLKQWLGGSRTIDQFGITDIPDGHLDIFKDIEFSIIWSDEEEKSFELKYRKSIEVIYSIGREDGKMLAIAMDESDSRTLLAKEYEDVEEVKEWIDREETKGWGYDSEMNVL